MHITGAAFYDITADDREAGSNGVVKDDEEDDGGTAVKDEPLDFTLFDR